jgi:hypothetical protein
MTACSCAAGWPRAAGLNPRERYIVIERKLNGDGRREGRTLERAHPPA